MERNLIVFTDCSTSSGAAGCAARTRTVAARAADRPTLVARRVRVDGPWRQRTPRLEMAAVPAVGAGVVEVGGAIAASEARLDARQVA